MATNLARKATLGALWLIAGSTAGRVAGVIANFFVAYKVGDSAYGEFNVAAVLALSTNTLTSLGIGQYLVAHPEAEKDVAFTAAVFHITLGFTMLAILLALGGPLATAFDAPNLPSLLLWMGVSIALERILHVPHRLLVRDMRFRLVAIRQFLGEIVFGVTSVILAYRGFGGFSLAGGNVARSLLGCIIVCAAVPRAEWLTWVPIKRETLGRLLRFGVPLSAASMLSFISGKWDNLVIAKIFGTGTVGQYNVAYNLADIPAVQIGEQIGDVLVPSFARVGDPEAKRRGLVRAAGLLSLAVFPLAVGLAVVAPTLKAAFFRDKWELVAPMLTLLSVLSVVRPIGWLVMSYQQAAKRTRVILVLEAFKVVVLLAALVTLGFTFGPLGACVGVGIAYALHSLASAVTVARQESIGVYTLLRPAVLPLLACAPMAAAVLGVRHLLGMTHLPPLVSLGIEVLTGACVYAVGALTLAREQARDFLRLIRKRGAA